MEYLAAVTLLILLLWGWRVLITGSAPFVFNGTTKRLGALVLAALISLSIAPNKVEGILAPFGAGTFLCFFLLALIAPPLFTEKIWGILRWTIMGVVSVVGLLVLYQFMGLSKFIEINAELLTVFIVTIPVIYSEVLHRKKSGPDTHMIAAIVTSVATLVGLLLTAYQIFPAWHTTTLPFWVNWQIILERYKNWYHLFFGVGAQHFLTAFTLGRPAALNMTPIWDTRFFMGSSLFFHIATVYGLAGVAALGWLLTVVHPVAILAFLFLPPSFPALVLVATILILSESYHPTSLEGSHPSRLIAIFVFLAVGTASYGLYRAFSAERSFERSLKAREALDGNGAYTYQIQAITKSPFVSRYRIAYSQTNLDLADAIAKNATSSADTRQTATQLIQQAIREAKIAVNLTPESVLAWENLAWVYQTLTGVAQGADQWSVASFQKAVSLDPTNPILRLRLGGAYVGQQKFDAAVQSYQAAINLKPDYANAYYNLAFVYRQQKKYLLAAQTIKETRRYVTSGADEERRLQEELDELTELLTEEEKQALATQTQGTPNVVSPLPESP